MIDDGGIGTRIRLDVGDALRPDIHQIAAQLRIVAFPERNAGAVENRAVSGLALLQGGVDRKQREARGLRLQEQHGRHEQRSKSDDQADRRLKVCIVAMRHGVGKKREGGTHGCDDKQADARCCLGGEQHGDDIENRDGALNVGVSIDVKDGCGQRDCNQAEDEVMASLSIASAKYC